MCSVESWMRSLRSTRSSSDAGELSLWARGRSRHLPRNAYTPRRHQRPQLPPLSLFGYGSFPKLFARSRLTSNGSIPPGVALIEARNSGADLDKAVAAASGWDKLARNVEEAERLARPDKADLPVLAARAWPVLHRLGPLFLGAFQLHAVPAAAATLRAVELLCEVYASGGRKWPGNPPPSFLRPAWREAVWSSGELDRRTWEAASAGDIWVEGSWQRRAVEEQLIPPLLFAAMREARPLPVGAPATAATYLAERKTLLERRLAEVAANAAADKLQDVRVQGGELKITQLKAATPEQAEELADRLYAMLPNVRITALWPTPPISGLRGRRVRGR